MQKITALILFCFLLNPGLKAQYFQYDTLAPKNETVYIHFLDLFSWSSPALKISYEKKRNNKLFEIEGSIINDFNARIGKVSSDERGIWGASLGLMAGNIRRESPSHRSVLGVRLNYAHKRRAREEWVFRRQGAYSQKINFTQINNNLGIYLRYNNTWYDHENLRASIAINPGYLVLFVDDTLPDGVQVNQDNGFFFNADIFSNFKSKGIYYYANLILEFNLGYTF